MFVIYYGIKTHKGGYYRNKEKQSNIKIFFKLALYQLPQVGIGKKKIEMRPTIQTFPDAPRYIYILPSLWTLYTNLIKKENFGAQKKQRKKKRVIFLLVVVSKKKRKKSTKIKKTENTIFRASPTTSTWI